MAWTRQALGPTLPYSLVFAPAGLFGVIGTAQLTRVPEPPLKSSQRVNPFVLIAGPFRHRRFRKVLGFLGSWAFAQNLAAPFFVVYMLSRMGLSLDVVVALTVLTQPSTSRCSRSGALWPTASATRSSWVPPASSSSPASRSGRS